MTYLCWKMAGGVGTDFMVFPNIRNCPAPCGNGYHRLGVFDSPDPAIVPVETHGRASTHCAPIQSSAVRLYETKCIIGGHCRYPIWRDFHQYNPQLPDIHFHCG